MSAFLYRSVIRASGWPTLTWIADPDKKFDDTVDGCRQRVLHLHRLDRDDDRPA